MNVNYHRQNPTAGLRAELFKGDIKQLHEPSGWLREADVLCKGMPLWIRLLGSPYEFRQVHGNHALLTSSRLDVFLQPNTSAIPYIEIPRDRIYNDGFSREDRVDSFFGRLGGITITHTLSDTPSF